MGTFTDIVNVVAMLTSPAAPVTGALVQRVVEVASPQHEQKLKTVEVEAAGQGTTYELALADAKTRALNKVSGTFVISNTQTSGRQQSTETAEYTGGVIRSLDVTSTDTTNGLVSVTIAAVIQIGKNNVVSATNIDPMWREGVAALLEEQQRQKQFVPALGNQPMYLAAITGVQAIARANFAEFKVSYNVKWSQKYVDDIKTFANTAGRLVNVGDKRTMYGVCLGTTAGWRPEDQCRDVSAEIPSIDKPLYLRIKKVYTDGSSAVEVADLRGQQNQLRVVTQPGTRFFHAQSSREIQYAKGVVIFEKGTVNGVMNLRIKLEEAARLASLEAEPFDGQ